MAGRETHLHHNFYWTDIFNFQANIADASYTTPMERLSPRPIWARYRIVRFARWSSPAAIVHSKSVANV